MSCGDGEPVMTHAMDRGRAGSYWIQRLPAWARIPTYALFFGGMWFLLSPDRVGSVGFRAAGAAAAGAFWSVWMFFVMRRWERRPFGDATPQQRMAVLRCLDTGRYSMTSRRASGPSTLPAGD
jgi:hypothetical protein